MSSAARRWWTVYAVGAALALAALAWISSTVLALERAEQRARREGEHQADVRLALWRMDSWFGPHLAREAARPFFEYRAYYPQERAYTRMLSQIEPGEVLGPSPLLGLESELLRIHFEIDADGRWSSPQVPTGDLLELARELPHLAARIEVQRAVLDRLQEEVSVEALRAAHARAEEELRALLGDERATSVEARSLAVAGGEVDQRELVQRARNSYIRPQVSGVQTSPIVAGPLVPLWLDAEDASRLFFVRRVGNGRAGLLQGFVGDWSRLRAVLLEQVRELFPGASLVRRGARGAGGDQLLATIPAGLVVPPARAGRVAGLSPARVTLVLSWSAALLALAAVGVTLRATISVGEQRSRFASAVTHELRTPLTTFRMYSEMLAEDMVPEEQRAEYLATLRRESDRLSHLLENVMSYARLEEGRGGLRLVPVSLQAILDRTLPILERHVRDAGASLEVDAPAAAQLVVDADLEAVGQILFNLVDNACKYGGGAAGTAIRLAVTGGTERVELRVRDDGQGIGHDMAHSIFRPFERGERSGDDVADAKPGIGLGLALARGLARDLGGDLSLEPADGRGACFCLSLRPSAA